MFSYNYIGSAPFIFGPHRSLGGVVGVVDADDAREHISGAERHGDGRCRGVVRVGDCVPDGVGAREGRARGFRLVSDGLVVGAGLGGGREVEVPLVGLESRVDAQPWSNDITIANITNRGGAS